jgi:acyl-homoserine-lactone acylase
MVGRRVSRARRGGRSARAGLAAALALLTAAGLAAPATAAPATGPAGKPAAVALAQATYSADVRWTDYGVPHVEARDHAGLGYGIGYASAQDNLCELADRMLTVTAQRSRFLGPGGGEANVVSDIYHQRLIDTGELERLLDGDPASVDTPSADARLLVRGFVAGINRYLRDVGAANLPDPRCQGRPWVRPVTEVDFWRTVLAGQQPAQLAGVVAARPPAVASAAAAHEAPRDPAGTGSNAYGLGREATKSGRGVLLGNPHYPWDGINRFYRMHLTIPGRLNVVGAGLMNTPIVGIGHNASMAWTHTVSTARRSGFFELTLQPGDPTAYLYEGGWRPMTSREVTVQVLRAGALVPETRRLYDTHHGPMVATGALPWTASRGFALKVAPEGLRIVDQYLAIWQAQDVRELRDVLARYQATGFNTTAADAGGETFFGDMGAIPHVTDAKAAACIISAVGQTQWANRVPVLDGSRAACEWGSDPDAVAPGIFGSSAQPQQFRSDFVTQMNDSHWLTNPSTPLTGYPRIFGDEGTQRSLRTRLGLQMVEQRLAGEDGLPGQGFDLPTLQQVMYNNRNLGAELSRDALVGLCRNPGSAALQAELAPACDVLAAWDLRVDLDSRGAHLFRVFAASGGLRWQVPFDPADPVGTPRGLDTAAPQTLQALVTAVRTVRGLGLPLDAPLSAVQTEPRGAERIPIHGGPGTEGIFNVITPSNLQAGLGWTKIVHGASWVMTVEFTDAGPRSQGVLTYSQSTNPASPHFADQTRLYSQKGWDDLRFTEAEVLAGTRSRAVLSEGADDCKGGGWQRFAVPTFASQGECVSHFTTLRGGVGPRR